MRIHLSLLLMPLTVLFMSADAPAQTPGVSGGELIDDCSNYPDSARPRNCALFATSFAEIANSGDRTVNPRGRLCIGKDVPVDELVKAINGWLAQHPGARNRSGYDVAYDALGGRHRCK